MVDQGVLPIRVGLFETGFLNGPRRYESPFAIARVGVSDVKSAAFTASSEVRVNNYVFNDKSTACYREEVRSVSLHAQLKSANLYLIQCVGN